MRFWTLLSKTLALLPVIALGCSSGQTGSPECAATESCVCTRLAAKLMFAGTLTTLENGSATVLVTEWADPMGYHDDLALGDWVGGAVATTLGCGDDAPSEVTVGDEVFVVYERGSADRYPDCAEYRTCSTTECGVLSEETDFGAWDACDGQCVTDTFQACSVHREQALLTGNLVILPRTGTLLLDGEEVTEADVARFYEPLTCETHFPPPPAPPCDDTVEMTSCGLAEPQEPFSSTTTLWGLLALATCVARRAGSSGGRPQRT